MDSKPIVAAFDFDKTITDRDTFIPFLLHTVGYFKAGCCLVWNAPKLIAACFNQDVRRRAKEAILTSLFKGMPLTAFQQLAKNFAEEKLQAYIRPQAIKRVQWHLQQGHYCIIVSASIENYILPWALNNGFRNLLASRLEVTPSGNITGSLVGKNCRGEEKVRRLEELLGPRSAYTLYAYGDSNGDKEMLASADFAFYRQFS